jgi:hypothetical protein
LPQIQPASRQTFQQAIANLLVLGRALVIAQDRFHPDFIDAQRYYKQLLEEGLPEVPAPQGNSF